MRNFERPGRSPVHATEAMAATSQPLATQTAIDVLKAGGNALDAAIAACAVQCVVEPQSTGVGGDCFCLYAPAANAPHSGGHDGVVAFNGSGKAPSAASIDYFQSNGIESLERPSPHSVVVPGAIDAWCQLNRDHGKMPLGELLQPAIDYARHGYPLTPRVYRDTLANREFLLNDDNASATFLINGQVPAVGHRMRQANLANTLEAIGKHGRDAFYTGEIANDIVTYLQSKGGLHTLDDFAATSGDYVAPISTEFRGNTVYECPPNGQGIIALLLLNIMSGLDSDTDPLSAQRIHLEIEACRLAYQARTRYVADPAQADVPIEALLSQGYADQLREAIDPEHATVPTQDIPVPVHHDTVYISVVDKDRNACSFINTLFWPYGSGLVSPNTGVVLTNRAEGFVLDPASPNCIAPNKRPLHTIIPALVERDGKIVMSFGVMGGEYQSMGHMQFLTRYLDFGLDIQEAQDAPRFMADPFSDEVEFESSIPDETLNALSSMGHTVKRAENPIGGSQAIAIDWEQGMLSGGSDPRKDGCAIGY